MVITYKHHFIGGPSDSWLSIIWLNKITTTIIVASESLLFFCQEIKAIYSNYNYIKAKLAGYHQIKIELS